MPDPQDPGTFERSKLDWSEPDREPHSRLLRWYRDLLALRRAEPDVRDSRLDRIEVTWSDRHFRTERGAFTVLVNLADEAWSCEVDGSVRLSWEPDVEVKEGRVDVPAHSAVVVHHSS